ncbi:MAG TPA: hypothetical protein VIE63_10800 [Ramlibacter sp.]
MMTEPPSRAGPKRRALVALLAATVFAAVAPLAAWTAWQAWDQLRVRQEQQAGELQRDATEFALSVNRELVSSVDALKVLSQSEIFQEGRVARWGRLLLGRPRRDWDSLFLLDPQGHVVLDTAPHPQPAAALHDLQAQALRKLAPVVSGAAGAQAGIEIAMPIVQGKHVRYVLGVRLSDSVWPRLASSAIVPPGGQARLLDAQGHLIGESAAPAKSGSYSASDTVPIAGWRVSISVPTAPVDDAQREIVEHALATSGAALLAGIILAAVLGRATLRRALR